MAKTKNVGTDLTVGRVLPILLTFAGPLIVANLLQQMYSTVDVIVIGQKLGSVGTVGVNTGGEIANMITFIAVAIGSASQILLAQLIGANDRGAISEATTTAGILTVIVSFIFTIPCLLFCDIFLGWLNCPAEAFEEAHNYMMIVTLGLPFVFGYNTVCGILRGMGESRKPLFFIVVATVVNIFLDILLVYVIPLRAAGTAIATTAAQVASFAAAAVYLYHIRDEIGISFRGKKLRMNRRYMWILLKLGIPLAAQSALIHFSQLICSAHVNNFGLVASATNSIGNRISKLVIVFTTSINTSAGAMVGQCLGARKVDRVKEVVYATIKMTMIIAVVLSAGALLFPKQIYALFTTDQEVIELGVSYMRSCIIIFFAAGFQGAYVSVVTGVGNAKLNFAIGVLDGVVLRLGISFLLAYVLEMGVVGFFYGNALARLGPVVVGFCYYVSGRWKDRKLLTEE